MLITIFLPIWPKLLPSCLPCSLFVVMAAVKGAK
jgi:hypothetical protein